MKVFFTLFFVVSISFLQAQRAGTVDKSYGNNTGTVRFTDKPAAQSVAIQNDNKLLIGSIDSLYYYQHNRLMLTRRNNDGTLDSSFGTNGHVITAVDDLRKNLLNTSGWFAIVQAPDGKIVTVGTATWANPKYPYDNLGDDDIIVARFLPNGTPDKTFGNKGRVVTNLGYLENMTSIAIQPDGKIVVVGSGIQDFYSNTFGILVVRYNVDGTLDNTFGGGRGFTLYNVGNGMYGYKVVLQPDNKIVIGGRQAGNSPFVFLRYQPDGLLDSSFGNNGAVKTFFENGGSGIGLTSMVLDAKGRIVATGPVGYNTSAVLVRCLPNGSLDSSFDGDGKLEIYADSYPYFSTNTILVQPQNKLTVSFFIIGKRDSTYRLALAGLNENGTYDSSFGTSKGKTITDLYVSTYPVLNTVMQTNGKILALNFNASYPLNDTTVAYYLTRFNGYKTPVVNNNIAARNTETVPTIITKQATIKISPNPAKNYIIISGLSVNNTTNITLNTAGGKVIKRLTSKDAARYRLSLAGIATGIYFINIQDANGNVKMKIVKE